MSQLPALSPTFIEDLATDLAELEVQLDSDPLRFGPKRLNGKVALARKMLSKTERTFLDMAAKHSSYKRAHRAATLVLEQSKKHLLANDPEVRAGRAVSERDAIASGKLSAEITAMNDLGYSVEALELGIALIKSKRTDLKDTQGRIRDQLRLCQEELGLGGRWGSEKPFRGTELEPGQGFADGKDVEDVDALIKEARSVADAELHVKAEVDDTDTDDEEEAELAGAAPEPEPDPEPVKPVFEKVASNAELVDDDFDFIEEDEPAEPVEPVVERVFDKNAEVLDTIIPGEDLIEEFGFLPHCEECGEPQFRVVGSGMCCTNGHGGSGSVPPPEPSLESTDEPPAAEVLPGTSKDADVSAFLDDTEVQIPSRRAVEEADEELDIDSILANFK